MTVRRYSSASRACVLAVLALVSTPAAWSATIVTGPVGKAAFQALVDAAAPGDRIRCQGGIYDFSDPGAVLLTKSVTIVAQTPANPPLFVGKTVDGTVDGDPVQGTPRLTGNTAFAVPPGAVVSGLKLQRLHFTGFERTISVGVGHDIAVAGCPPLAGADLADFELTDNDFRKTRQGLQVFGGPLRSFKLKGNRIDTTGVVGSNFGILIVGDSFACPVGGALVDAVRPADGQISNNVVLSGGTGIAVFGARRVSVKNNEVTAVDVGVYLRDRKAAAFADDGPIALGSATNNTVAAGLIGIMGEGPTTLDAVSIKNNVFAPSVFDVFLHRGANRFVLKGNVFSGASVLAEVWLGIDETNPFGLAPDSHDNHVTVPAGTRVFDFGVGNVVVFK